MLFITDHPSKIYQDIIFKHIEDTYYQVANILPSHPMYAMFKQPKYIGLRLNLEGIKLVPLNPTIIKEL